MFKFKRTTERLRLICQHPSIGSYDGGVDTSEIATLLRPFAELSHELLAQTSQYLALLLKWNARMNLTGVRRPEEMITRHFGESFFAAKMLFLESGPEAVIDVGSGAGFPGLPVAMSVPEAAVVLIEADGRKAAFLNEVIRTLGLRNARVLNRRAEACTETADVVTMRAVEKFERALPAALALVREGGRIALMVGAEQLPQVESFVEHVGWDKKHSIPGSIRRVLLVGTKGVQDSGR